MVTVFPAPYVTCTFASQPSRLLNCSRRFFPIISFSHMYLSFLPTTDLTCTSILKTALSSFSHRRSPEMRIARTPFKGKSASVAIRLWEDISLNCFVRGFCDFQVQSVVVLWSQFIWPSPFLTPDPSQIHTSAPNPGRDGSRTRWREHFSPREVARFKKSVRRALRRPTELTTRMQNKRRIRLFIYFRQWATN